MLQPSRADPDLAGHIRALNAKVAMAHMPRMDSLTARLG